MLDIQFIRDNPDIVLAAIKNKNRGPIDLERILKLADERKVLAGIPRHPGQGPTRMPGGSG